MSAYILFGLTKGGAELSGEAETFRSRLAQIATDVGHLDTVIRQFDPDYDLDSIQLRRPRARDAARRSKTSRFLLQALLDAVSRSRRMMS